MNTFPKDPYADALLLQIKISVPGAIILRDAYADSLLNDIHNEAGAFRFPIDEKATTYVAPRDLEK